jgi:hypothetical protein
MLTIVQPNFSPGDYVLRAEPKRFQHKLTLVWKGLYQVDKDFDNHTLRVNSLINGAQFITHVTRTRFYQVAMLQTAENLQAATQFNNTVIDNWPSLKRQDDSRDLRADILAWFDEAENTVEPIYEKWIDVPRMLKNY